jgi:uncharacterized protein
MIDLGELNALEVLRETSVGLYLGDGEGHEILLPWKYVPGKCPAGAMLDVFIYHDGEERLIATTLEPKITLHRFARLQVAGMSSFGAFMDWGLENDLLVPWREMAFPLKQGQHAVVFLYMDEKSGRLAGSTRIGRYLSKDRPELKEGDKVEALVWEQTKLGYKAIVNQQYSGLLYGNEVFRHLQYGETVDAWVKAVRDDLKIDLLLQEPGYGSIDRESEQLLASLRANDSFLPLNDSSSPELISKTLGISKKTFKKCVGHLLKLRMISIEENGIRLMPDPDQK